MSIATRLLPAPAPARTARWLTAALLAPAIVILLVVPALAADPGPGGAAASAAALAEASGSPSPDPSSSASPDPSTPPSPDPSASSSPDPSASPSASPSESPTTPPSPTPTPWPTPSYPSTITTLGDTVRFFGNGYGHGVGLNQHGARGRATAGQTAEEILAAYFNGAVIGRISPNRQVRVLLMTGYPAVSSAPLQIKGHGGSWAISTSSAVFPPGATLRAWRTTTKIDGVSTTVWKVKVLAADGSTVLYGARVSGAPVVRPVDAGAFLQLVSKPSRYDTYRGTLTLVLKASTLRVVNTLGMDAYLRGAVPAEMPSSWPKQALRAQAIASRSYAAKRLHPTRGIFDVYDDTRSQVYRGIEAEKASTDAVIAAEPGAVIRFGSKIVNAFYFSTGGGSTESNEYVFVNSSGAIGSPVAYLRGIIDRSAEGIPYDADAPYYRWATSTLTRDQLTAMFKADSRTSVGTLLRLDLRKRGPGGRLRAVVLMGSAGTKTVSADVFRSVYNARRPAGTLPLRSNLFSTDRLP